MNNRYQVKTETGFKSFTTVRDAGMKRVFRVTFESGKTITVSGDHRFITETDEPILVHMMGNGVRIKTDTGIDEVSNIDMTGEYLPMYDLTDVDNTEHTYYTDGVLSHNCEFLGSTNILVDVDILDKISEKMTAALKLTPGVPVDMDGIASIIVYTPPIPGHSYVVGCDIADGVGGDETVIKVFDITHPMDIKEVALLHNNLLSTTYVPFILAKIGTDYNIAPILVENNFGGSVVKLLADVYEYENLVANKAGKPGIYSTNPIKVEACLNLKSIICNPVVNVTFMNSMFVDQLKYFEKRAVSNGIGYTYGSKHKNDDHVIATAWAFYILRKDLLEFYFDAEYSQFGLTQLPTVCKNFYSPEDVQAAKDSLAEKAKIANTILMGGGNGNMLASPVSPLAPTRRAVSPDAYLHDEDAPAKRRVDDSFEYFDDQYFGNTINTTGSNADW